MVLIALMLIVILVRQLVGRYELKSEYRRQVHRARKLRNAKLDKRKSEAEQHGFETIRDEVRSAAVDPASSGGEGRKNQEADQKTETQSGADRPDEAVVAAIVAAISALEKERGFLLFERTGRQIGLTKYGRQYFHEVLPVLEQLERVTDRARQWPARRKGIGSGL